MDVNYIERIAAQIRERIPTSDIPDESNIQGLFRIYAVLLLAKGSQVVASDVHNAWVAWMLGIDSTHDSLIPFTDLNADTAADDEPYVEAIRFVAANGSFGNER